jgi:hypothetical protein
MRLRLSAAACGLLLAAAVALADDPKPNTLTPKEAAEGWIHLFDGETTYGWKTEGDVKVDQGVMVIDGAKKGKVTTNVHFPVPVEMFVVWKWTGTGGASFGVGGHGHVIPKDEWVEMKMTLLLDASGSGAQTSTSLRRPGEGWKPGNASSGGLGPTTVGTMSVSPGTTVYVRSVRLRPLGMKSLFNGKDLTGWKVFDDPKRSATKFEVTRDGELSAKNGPGDLQSEDQFANFMLQLECKTNGKWLNSGVFFRCIPGQYQNGYEAQIHNGFKDNDRTKPVDFGTGAIYRRIPARKVVSNDMEWFTMTVLADGNHFATWVNGYQTVDWTDERAPNENPRQGYRAEKGHISLQGHDPTTDLLFRNVRIAELPSTTMPKK